MMELSLFNLDNSYELIRLDESLCINSPLHCAHCAIYSPNSFPIFETYECKAYISVCLSVINTMLNSIYFKKEFITYHFK